MTTDRRSDIRSLIEANATRLPDGISVEDVAAKCRGAALMILESGEEGWGKPELAAWLAGPYRATTSYSKARPIGIPASSRRMRLAS